MLLYTCTNVYTYYICIVGNWYTYCRYMYIVGQASRVSHSGGLNGSTSVYCTCTYMYILVLGGPPISS